MTESLVMEVEVACAADHAFDVWTRHVDQWWPKNHSQSGAAELTVTIEPGVGGRIYERTDDGTEHDWGEVLTWDPPRELRYMWHIASTRDAATEVQVTFQESGGATTVRVNHRGWDQFGGEADDRRAQNRLGWGEVLPLFVEACRSG